MKKFKSINKRVLALLLSILMLLTSGIISAVAVTVDLAETGATITSDGTARLYFNMSAVNWWVADSGNKNFAYFFNNSTGKNAWSTHAVKYDSGNTYYVTIPSGSWAGVILTRNDTTDSPSWNNKWNQTGDITLSSTSNYLSKFADGSTSVTWGTAVKPASTASVTPSATTVAPGETVTLTPKLTSNEKLNTIKSTTYSTTTGASITDDKFTATVPGTYTVTATVTYYPNGYDSITSTATATTTITVKQSVVAPATPAAPTVEFKNTYGGTGTENDPYLVKAGVKPSMTITGGLGDADGLAYNVNYTAIKVPLDAGVTSVEYNDLAAPALGEKKTVNTYLWAYNGSKTSPLYSESYATTTQYIKGVYTVVFNDSDNNKIGDTVIYDGTAISAPEAPSVEGYTFTGWTADGTFYSKDTALAIKKNTTFTATYSADPYSFDLTCDATAGSVTIDPENEGTIHHDDKITLTAKAKDGYNFTGWSGSNGTDTISGDTNPLTITVKGDVDITANFVVKAKCTVNVTNANTSQGTLSPMGSNEVYSGDSFTVTADPKSGYAVDYWTINGESTTETGKTLTLENITAKTTNVSIVWKVSTEVNVSVKATPYGSATVTANNTANSVTVQSGTNVALKAEYDSNVYEFVKWSITGKYSTEDNLADANITIVPTAGGTITATAELRQIAQYVYAEVKNGWKNVNLYRFNFASDTNAPAWPGAAMEKYATKNGNDVYRVVVPLGNGMVIFNNGTNQTDDLTFSPDKNYYTLADGSGYGWSDDLCPGFFLKVNNEEIYMTEASDGTFSVIYDFENTSSSQSVNASVTDYWKTAVSGATCTGTASAPCRVKYTFNPYTNELTYTVSEIKPQITVYLDNGTIDSKGTKEDFTDDKKIGQTNASFADNPTGLISVGALSYYKQDNFTDKGGYRKALVDQGTNLIFTTTMETKNSEGVCDYYVAGWVVNGEKFVTARYMGKNSSGYEYYQGNYTFTEDRNTVVPIYFHTDAWLKANGVETVKVYAVTDKNVTNWDKYMGAYVWYDSEYEQFGLWQGQLMIPGGLSGVYYTFVEKTDANKNAIDGITFNNFGYNGERPSYPVTEYANIQTYDYSEFMKLLAQGKENITFVLKPETDTAHHGGSFSTNVNIAKTYDFDVFTDASGTKPWDIHRNAVTSETVGLYIVREFLYDPDMKYNDVGTYSVRCHLYEPDGTYIGYCSSNELLDIPTLSTKDGFGYLASDELKGETVMVAYESVTTKDNGTRYDGEWYGDADVNVKVNLNVQVGLTENDGANYTVDTDDTDGLNVAGYGSAFAEGGAVATVVKGKSAALKAVPAKGYKFIGWYSSKEEKLSASITHTINDVSFDTTVTAVFQALKGGEFVITHTLYAGGASGYNPEVFTGTGDLYIGVADADGNDIDPLAIRDTLTFTAKEGSTYIIKIATDPHGADKFYSWYVGALDKFDKTTYEEVGVDNYVEGSEYGNLFDNKMDTIVGSNDRVEFWFKHTIDSNFTSLDLYSSIKEVSANVKLIYKYEDRYGATRTVVVPYVLTDKEVDAGYCPSYETVKNFAPYVDDYYTEVTWDITKLDSTSFELWADQEEPVYTVSANCGPNHAVKYGTYNSLVEFNANTDFGAKSDKGFWFEDANVNQSYDEGEKIVAYGRYYGLRVTESVNLCYVEDDSIDFDIVLDEPVYTREQETDASGNLITDKVYIDYLTSILIPLFRNSKTPGGKLIKDTYYNGNVIPNANSPVTIETLTEHFDYEIEYGVILEQLRNKDDMGTVITDDEILKKYLDNNGGYDDPVEKNKYATIFNATTNPITNKNRILITIDMNNTDKNRNRYYNVYGYLKVKDDAGVTKYYFSDMRTLNIYATGTTEGAVIVK